MGCSSTAPIFFLTWLVGSSPNQLYDPAVGLMTLISIPSVVVLPLPLGPNIPKTCPRFTSRFRLLTAVSRRNFFVRFLTDKTVSTEFYLLNYMSTMQVSNYKLMIMFCKILNSLADFRALINFAEKLRDLVQRNAANNIQHI